MVPGSQDTLSQRTPQPMTLKLPESLPPGTEKIIPHALRVCGPFRVVSPVGGVGTGSLQGTHVHSRGQTQSDSIPFPKGAVAEPPCWLLTLCPLETLSQEDTAAPMEHEGVGRISMKKSKPRFSPFPLDAFLVNHSS